MKLTNATYTKEKSVIRPTDRELRDMVMAPLKVTDIARRCDVSQPTVSRWLKAAGLSLRHRQGFATMEPEKRLAAQRKGGSK